MTSLRLSCTDVDGLFLLDEPEAALSPPALSVTGKFLESPAQFFHYLFSESEAEGPDLEDIQ